ncbi:MAG: hypothetical protein EXR99_02745 [Gemmataceae bacterium]|nr:hypothetical protein [Gemmataceae bacterium]
MARLFDALRSEDSGKTPRKSSKLKGKPPAQPSAAASVAPLPAPLPAAAPEPVQEIHDEMSFVEVGPQGFYSASADVLACSLDDEMIVAEAQPVPALPMSSTSAAETPEPPEENSYSHLLEQLLKDFPSPREGALLFVTLPSVRSGETVFQLAKEAASQGEVVLVETKEVQGNGPSGLKGRPGWIDILEGKAELEDCLKDAGVEGLKVITAGKVQLGRKSIKLFSRSPRGTLRALRKGHRLVMIDGGVWSEEASGIGLARECDGVCLLVPAAKVGSTMVEEILARIEDSGINLAGLLVLPRNVPETKAKKAA